MKFQVGDQVVVLLSNEEGRVVEIINDKMVLVEVRGVKFPAYTDQLDFPYFKRFTEKKLFPETKAPKKFIDTVPKEKKTPVQKIADGFFTCFKPSSVMANTPSSLTAPKRFLTARNRRKRPSRSPSK